MELIILQSSFISITIFNAISVLLAATAWIALKIIFRIKIVARASETFSLSMIALVVVALLSLYLFYDAIRILEIKETIPFFFSRFVRYFAFGVFIWASSSISSRLFLFLCQLSRRRQGVS